MSKRRYIWVQDGAAKCHCGDFEVLFVEGDTNAGPFKCYSCQGTFMRSGRLVEVTPEYVGQRRDEGRRSEEEVYGHTTATDGTDLSTRARHRNYMRERGLTVASDFTETWAKAALEKKKAVTPGSGFDSKERKEQLGRLNYQMRQKRR